MIAAPGDHIVVKSHHVGTPDREAEVLEVHGEAGGPPYLVRWTDDGHESVFFPSQDAFVTSQPEAAAG